MSKLPRISVNIVGVVAIIVALGGLIYNGISLSFAQSGAYSDLIKQQKLSYFYQAFYAMSGICIICYVIILLSGIALIRKRDSWSIILTGVLIFEVIYFLANSLFWALLEFDSRMSVAAATGVANGGLTIQGVILFPLWAPFLLRWAKKKIIQEPQAPSYEDTPDQNPVTVR